MSGLRLKLIIAFALISLLPLLLVGLVSVYSQQLTHEQDIAELESTLLKQKQNETQKFFDEVMGLFEIKVGYDSTSIISEPDQKFLLEKLLQENKFITEAAFIDLNGIETAKSSRLQDASLMGLNDVRGLPKFTTGKAGQRYSSAVYETLNGPMMSVAAPVYNRSGKVIMVLSGEISLRTLKNLYYSATLGNTGYLYAVDSNENIVAGSDKNLIDKKIYNFQAVRMALFGEKTTALETRKGLLSNSVLAMQVSVPSQNWKIVAEWPTDDAYAAITYLRLQFIIFAGAVLALVIIIGWVIGRSILKPLADLRSGAEKFGHGNLDYEIKITTGDEIEMLGKIMNKMAVDLKKHGQELELSHQKIEAGLREISKLKDDFIFVAAHELRSPVTVLQGYVAEILDDKKTVSKLKKMNPYFLDMVEGIEVSKDRLSALVDDLLNIARMEAGKFKISIKENVDIKLSVGPVVETLKELGKPRQISLAFKIKGKVPPLKIDPDRVNEILTNLISNAIKYNKNNGQVTVTAYFAHAKIWFEVADTGIGLSPEEQQHLFEKFWRSEEVNKVQGTGLGLFIVKHMIEQLGGTITFVSKKGKGTSFTFSLPAV